MKQLLLLIILTLSINIGYSKELIISTDTEIVKELLNQKKDLDLIADFEKTAIIKIKENSIEEITKLAHEKGRCGGFFVHETVEDALKSTSSINKKANKTNYTVQNLKFVQEAITKVEEKNIRDFIIRLSTLHNRFYQSDEYFEDIGNQEQVTNITPIRQKVVRQNIKGTDWRARIARANQ